MATLLLNRRCIVNEDGTPGAFVICEPRLDISRGWLARISPDPENPYGLWRRDYLSGGRARLDGRDVVVYPRLDPGAYEAHSTLRSRKAQAVCFLVTPERGIEILGGRGDEDVVIARLHGMSPDDLHDARAAAADDAVPALEGSFRQVAWARTIKDALVDAALEIGDDELAVRLWDTGDATWFIANRDRPLEELREQLVRADRGTVGGPDPESYPADGPAARPVPPSGRPGPGRPDRGRGGP